MALGWDDPFSFVLAEGLGKHLHELGEMPNQDYVRWVAFYTWRNSREQHAANVARARARR